MLLAADVFGTPSVQNSYDAPPEVLAHDSQGNLLVGWLATNADGGCPQPDNLELSFYNAATQTWSTPDFPPTLRARRSSEPTPPAR